MGSVSRHHSLASSTHIVCSSKVSRRASARAPWRTELQAQLATFPVMLSAAFARLSTRANIAPNVTVSLAITYAWVSASLGVGCVNTIELHECEDNNASIQYPWSTLVLAHPSAPSSVLQVPFLAAWDGVLDRWPAARSRPVSCLTCTRDAGHGRPSRRPRGRGRLTQSEGISLLWTLASAPQNRTRRTRMFPGLFQLLL